MFKLFNLSEEQTMLFIIFIVIIAIIGVFNFIKGDDDDDINIA